MEKSKFVKTILLAVVIVGGIWVLVHRDKISKPDDALALIQRQLGEIFKSENIGDLDGSAYFAAGSAYGTPEEAGRLQNYSNESNPAFASQSSPPGNSAPARLAAGQNVTNVIRLAVFKLNPSAPFINHAEPVRLMAEICRQYDVVALQCLNRNDTTWVKRITDQMNQLGAVGLQHRLAAGGPRSDYIAISDRGQREGTTQTVIIFNRQTVQLDQSKWYVVDDPDNMFKHDPMVAWFRSRGVPPQRAFTFSMVCMEIDQQNPRKELAQIGLLMRTIRNDGRGEDDVILVGDFQADDRGLDAIRNEAGLSWVVTHHFTNVARDRQYDNIVFSENPTTEFTGRGGCLDFAKQYGLQPVDAAAVAQRLPVWAEFSVFENGQNDKAIPGRIASLPAEPAAGVADQPAER